MPDDDKWVVAEFEGTTPVAFVLDDLYDVKFVPKLADATTFRSKKEATKFVMRNLAALNDCVVIKASHVK